MPKFLVGIIVSYVRKRPLLPILLGVAALAELILALQGDFGLEFGFNLGVLLMGVFIAIPLLALNEAQQKLGDEMLADIEGMLDRYALLIQSGALRVKKGDPDDLVEWRPW